MATKWLIDPTHSEIQFKAKHLMISTVTGHFGRFNAGFETEAEDIYTSTNIWFTADIDSISTRNNERDTHLKSEDFFNAREHGQITFRGTDFDAEGSEANLEGELTIRGVIRPVMVDVEYGGTVIDSNGKTKAGFTVSGKISRKEFGLTWNALTEAGAIVVSDDIHLYAEVQFIKQI